MSEIQTRPLRDRGDLVAVLRKGFDLIQAEVPGLRYRLVGTAAARLQGVDLPVGDIDLLLARRSDIDAVAAALAHLPCVTPPQWIEVSHQYYACYSLACVGCGLAGPADQVAAVNVRDRARTTWAFVNTPNVADTPQPAADTSDKLRTSVRGS